MGNFEVNEPTTEQLNALMKLSTALMIRYRINPDSEVHTHSDQTQSPYVKDSTHTSFIGHKDVGKTKCPGKNLYNKLPLLTQAIHTQLLTANKNYPIKKARILYHIDDTQYLTKDTSPLSISKPIKNIIRRCISSNKNITIRACKKQGNTITMRLSKKRKTT